MSLRIMINDVTEILLSDGWHQIEGKSPQLRTCDVTGGRIKDDQETPEELKKILDPVREALSEERVVTYEDPESLDPRWRIARWGIAVTWKEPAGIIIACPWTAVLAVKTKARDS